MRCQVCTGCGLCPGISWGTQQNREFEVLADGCMEAVDDGVSGFLREARDADSLYERMKKFIRLPREKRAEMGRNGRMLMVEKFEKSKIVKETVEALKL